MARKRQIPSWGTKETEQTVNVDQENVAVIDKSMEDTRVANESSNLSIQLNFKTKCKTFSLRSSKVFNLNQFHNCLFCKQKFTYIFRHFVKKHRSQLDVSCALPMDKRLKQFIRLKRLGDFINNVYYLKSKEGKLIVLTQSERFLGKCEPEKFVPCPDCTGFIHESQLFSHYFKCIAKQPRHVPVTKRKLLKESRLLLRHTLLTSAFSINKLLPFRVGLNKFIKAAKNDECLSLFGKHMVEIKSQSDDKYLAVRSMMQRLGCILVSCRRLSHNPHLTMSELLVPDNINLLIRSIRSLLLSKTESLQKLELSTDLFSKINACVFFLRSNCLMEGKLNKADQYLRFYYIFLETWEKQIGDLGVNKMTDLPLVTNLINLKKNLELTIIKLIDKIKVSKYNINSIWCDLAESTLSLICLFNAVEFNIIELLKIKEYAVRPDWSVDELEEYKDKLPNFTYYLAAKRFLVSTNFYGKEYYILFTKVIKKAIDVLISSRYRTSISPNNGFVFANLNYSLTSFKSVNCFLNLCVKTGYLKADQLRDVKSRKYLSFLTQIIDMSPEEATWAIKYIPIDDRKSRKKLNFELESELYRALDIWRIHLKEETNSSPKQQDGSSSNK